MLTQYFTEVTADACSKGQLETVTGGMGALSGSIVMLVMAVFCKGPPSDELMYSAVRLPNPTPFLRRVRDRQMFYPRPKTFFLSRKLCATVKLTRGAQGLMHLLFFIDQVVGLVKGNFGALKMPREPMLFWIVVNFIWTVASFWAASSSDYPIDYPEGESVFGLPWNTLFWVTGCGIVGTSAIKSIITTPVPGPALDSSSEAAALTGAGRT